MTMNYVVKPSLEHIALVKVAASLWSQNDIRNVITNFSFPSLYSELLRAKPPERFAKEKEIKVIWDAIEECVVERVADLPLPQFLKNKVSIFIKVVGLKILKWMAFIYQSCGLQLHLPSEFHWTAKGTIDELKTAEVFIKDESIDIATRYKLSCIYCSQNDVLKLWREMPEECKKYFYSEDDDSSFVQHDLVIVWTYDIIGEMVELDQMFELDYGCSAYEYAFKFAAISGNKAAIDYFLQKIKPAKVEQLLIYAGINAAEGISDTFVARHGNRGENYSEVLCALLSKMDKKQQIKVFKANGVLVLYCLLEWPFQAFFMETANRMWSFLQEMDFGLCLKKITCKMQHGYRDYDYKKLFKELWKQSPNSYKRYQLSSESRMYRLIIRNLFELGDMDSITFLYRDATVEEKRRIIYDDNSMNICSCLIDNKQWNLLKFFITESLPTRDMMIKFKRDFEEKQLWTFSYDPFQLRKKKWQKFRHMLIDLVYEFSKRKCVDNVNNPNKKRCVELNKI